MMNRINKILSELYANESDVVTVNWIEVMPDGTLSGEDISQNKITLKLFKTNSYLVFTSGNRQTIKIELKDGIFNVEGYKHSPDRYEPITTFKKLSDVIDYVKKNNI